MEKQNDMFAIVMGTPDVNQSDLLASNVELSNTSLKDKEYYKNLPKIKQSFMNTEGKFDEKVFDAVYNKAASLVNDLGNDDYLTNLVEYDPYDITAPIGSKKFEPVGVISKDFNPMESRYSRTGINEVTSSMRTPEEIAQNHKIWDSKKGEWMDKSANDWGIKSLFKETLVYAKWDEDGDHLNEFTGLTEKHKKGDWKFDKEGKLYTETLNHRDVFNKEIVNPTDILTVDGSSFNTFDVFDSDGRSKNPFKVTAKLALELAPFFIPGVNVYYGGLKMAMGLASALPIFYKAGEGILTGDTTTGNESGMWKTMNDVQGFMSKYTTRPVSEAGKQGMFNYEQIASLVGDVFSQIYEQRAAASLSQLVYKINSPAYANKLKEIAVKKLSTSVGEGLVTDNADDIMMKAMSKVNEIESKRNNLAKSLSLGYMALTQSSSIYNDALNGGYDERTAGFAALLAATGQYGLMMNNRMGTWFLDKTTGYTEDVSKASLRKVIKDEFENIKKGVDLIAVDKPAGKKVLGGVFSNVKNKISTLLTELPETGESMWKNAVIEGIEEGTEQAAIDMSKGVIDFLSYAGLTQAKGSFGGFQTVFSKEGLYNYVQNILGGAVGGSLFSFHRGIIEPKLNKVEISPDVENDLIRQIANGNKEELLKIVEKEKSKFASTEIGAIKTSDGTEITDDKMSQADVLSAILKEKIELYDRLLNTNNLVIDDETLIEKTIMDEIVISDMRKNKTDSYVLSNFQDLTKDIINLSKKVETFEKDKVPEDIMNDLNEKRLKVKSILEGNYSEYYHGLSLFVLNKDLHKPFAAMTLEDYAEIKYHKDLSELDSDAQGRLDTEFKEIMEDKMGFKAMQAKYDMFLSINSDFSKEIKDYESTGYSDLRKYFYTKLQDDKTPLLEVYKNFQVLKALKDPNFVDYSGFNPKINFNTNVDLSLGKFLVDDIKIIDVSDEDREAKIKQIDSFGLQNSSYSDLSQFFGNVNKEFDTKIETLNKSLSEETTNAVNLEIEKLESERTEENKEKTDKEIENLKHFISPEYKEEIKESIENLEKSKIKLTNTGSPLFPFVNQLLSYAEQEDELDNEVVDDLIDSRQEMFKWLDKNVWDLQMATDTGQDLQNEIALAPEEWEHKSLVKWLSGIYNVNLEDVYDQFTPEEKKLLNNITKESGNPDLTTNIEKINKVLDKPRKVNRLYDKLKEFQFNLFGDRVTIFNVLQSNIDKFGKVVTPSDFILSDEQLKLINKALDTINVVDSVSTAMLATEISPSNIYGYNVLLQKSSDKLNLGRKYEVINKESYNTISSDLNQVKEKLLFFKYLAESNSGSELEIQNKIKENTSNVIFKKLTDPSSNISLLNITINGTKLLSVDDVASIPDEYSNERKLAEISQKIYANFKNLSKDDLNSAIDQLIAPFKNLENFTDLLDFGRNTNFSSDINDIALRDYYFYIASIISSPIKDFYSDYKKIVENELTLQTDKKAPFFSQKLVEMEVYSFVKNPNLFSKFIEKSGFTNEFESPSFPLSKIFFIKGTGGTGKTSVIMNFLLRMIQNNKDFIGSGVNVKLSAPTTRTLKTLSESATRNVALPFSSSNVKEDLLKSLFINPSDYSEMMSEWDTIKENFKKGEKIEKDKLKYFSINHIDQNEVKVLPMNFKQNLSPELILIDELGGFNPIELQILEQYGLVNPATRIIGAGDEFQDGEFILDVKGNKTSYSLENVFPISSIKMKSSIRANNGVSSDNITALERWVEDFKVYSYQKGAKKPLNPKLNYNDTSDYLIGHKFGDNEMNVPELRKLNPEKEIVFVTEDGTLSDNQKNIIKEALGITNPTVTNPDLKSQEFDQLVILSKLMSSSEPSISERKHLYTLLSRAKEGTLIFNNKDLIDNKLIIQESTTSVKEKKLNESTIDFALNEEVKNLTDILENYTPDNKVVTISSSTKVVIPNSLTDINDEEESVKDPEISEEKKPKYDDKKFLCYSFFNNLGLVTDENLWDSKWSYKYKDKGETKSKKITIDTEVNDLKGLFEALSTEFGTGTDLFALKIPDSYFNRKKTLREIINDYIEFKNSLLFNRTNGLVVKDNFGLNVSSLFPEMKVIGLDKYSQSFGKIANNNFVSGRKYFVGYNIKGTFVTVLALPDIKNNTVESAFGEDKTKYYKEFLAEVDKDPKGRTINEENFYKKLESYTNTVVPKTSFGSNNKRLSEGIQLDQIGKYFPGATISEPMVFYKDAVGETERVNHIQNLFKDYDQYKPGVDYSSFTFRPYVIISYSDGSRKHSRLMVLSSKKRGIKKLFEEIKNPVGETTEEIKDYRKSLISKYDGWKLLSDYFLYLREHSDLDVDKLHFWGETQNEFDELIQKLLKQENYEHLGLNDVGQHWQVLKRVLQKVQENKSGEYRGFSELVKNDAELRSLIIGKSKDAFGELLSNPVFLLNSIQDLLPYWDSEDKKTGFLNNYKEQYYYNTRIEKSTKFEGKLPKNLYQNYVLNYALEPPKYLLNLETYDDLFTDKVVKKEQKVSPKVKYTIEDWIKNIASLDRDLELEGKFPITIPYQGIKDLYNDLAKYKFDNLDSQFIEPVSNYIKQLYTVVQNSRKSKDGEFVFNRQKLNLELLIGNLSKETKSELDNTIRYGPSIIVEYNGNSISHIRIFNSLFESVDTTQDISCNLI